MKTIASFLMLTAVPLASANALPSSLHCTEKTSYADRSIVVEHDGARGNAKVFDYNGIDIIHEFVVQVTYGNGYAPTMHIQNWDWFPRFDMDLVILPEELKGTASITSDKGEDQFNVTCSER